MLVATVVGSGIMAETLTNDTAVALLGNTAATGAILAVLITALGPVSGAHFNPAVTLAFAFRRDILPLEALMYAAVQISGGVLGTVVAHLMFEQSALQVSETARTGPAQWLAEAVATFGLVGLYISAAYWFTASTSFANPAVTIARSLTDTFSGVRPVDVPAFIGAQAAGALLAAIALDWLFRDSSRGAKPAGEAKARLD